MSSSRLNFISIDDAPEEIEKKITSAFCPIGEVKDNPVLEIFEYHIFRRISEVTIKRPERFGGPISFENYAQMEKAFASKELHPKDLKDAASEYLIEFLTPVREHLKKKGY
jgi:tyrosyl-tRNA synthetase